MRTGFDSVNCTYRAISIVQNMARSSGGLIEQEGSLDLILPLLVPRWRGLVAYVPTMIVNIPGITASVRRLRLGLGIRLVSKTLFDHELFVLILQLLQVLPDLVRAWE